MMDLIMMKRLAEEFEQQLTCLEKNVEKHIKVENGKEITKTISCGLKFIDSPRFMGNSLSNLVNKVAEEIHKF